MTTALPVEGKRVGCVPSNDDACEETSERLLLLIGDRVGRHAKKSVCGVRELAMLVE